MDVLVKIDPELRQTTEVLYPICEVYCLEDTNMNSSLSGFVSDGLIKSEDIMCIATMSDGMAVKEERQFKCSLCGMAFKNRYHLNRHTRTHNDLREFVCQVCKASFKRKEHLARHTENVHFHSKLVPPICDTLGGFKCETCNEHFPYDNLLQEHSKIHEVAKEIGNQLVNSDNLLNGVISSGVKTPPSPTKKLHMCNICNTSFTRNHHLHRHMLSHSDIRKYECPTCHSMFRRKEHLERHKYVHSEIRLHKCLQCEKTFKRREHLYKHMSRHGNMWRPFNES